MTRFLAWALAGLLLTALGLGACRREPAATAPGDPVAAVQGLVKALRDNDLVRYSELSLPPALHARVEARWAERQKLAPPPSAEDRAEFDRRLARLTAPGAETELYESFDRRLAKIEDELGGQWALMQGTASIFLKAAVEANDQLSPAEKDHAGEVIAALMAWAQPSLFTDRARARQAIAEVTRTARELGIANLDQARALPMRPALAKGGIGLAGLKRLARIYGMDVDAMLDRVQATLVSAEGDRATVKVSYPLLDRTVSFEMGLVRRDGAWYSANAVREAEAALAEPLPLPGSPDAPPAPVEPAEPARPTDAATPE